MLARALRTFVTTESGQGTPEYALVIALVAIVAIAAIRVLGTKANDSLNNGANRLAS